jgi:hypothetical protein
VKKRLVLEDVAADHRAAIEEFAQAVETLDRNAWNVARAAGKWTPAEIAQHLILSYGPPMSELGGGAGFAVRLPWWKRTFLRRKVLPKIVFGEEFPKGAPAPREIRPREGASSPESAARLLRENAGEFARRLCEAHAGKPVRLTHSYFGRLTAPQILKLMAVHARHHRAQLRAPRSG